MSLDTMTREEIEAELTHLGKKLSEAITGDGEGLTEDEKDRWGVLHKAWIDTERSEAIRAKLAALLGLDVSAITPGAVAEVERWIDAAVEVGQSIGEMSTLIKTVKGLTDDL